MKPIAQISSSEVYRNNWMSVREDTIARPDGSTGIYGVVDRPDYAVIIAVDGDRLALVEQFRYPLDARRWEFPMGTVPGGHAIEPAELAARELREETGLTAGSLVVLGRLDVAPGIMSQRGWVFLATDLTQGEPEREPEEQDMHFAWFERSRFEEMIRTGVVTDAQSIAAYAQLLLAEGR
ncbi:NUDIX hydrolase [Mycobacterium sp. shizuoka-1]|uniref:NUDIX domain-containing protein n=1 Tax=Mycobacterium sp. shizuoka-1 TaxID=2039281 RepID=UPI000C062AB2|nr:NUDIX hydrolase [Mycobacterium sp. shizuoka-1]GAY16178.1 ADP-ribose pyrophosphatase [Mycobacterium sp. shizuoka-1]